MVRFPNPGPRVSSAITVALATTAGPLANWLARNRHPGIAHCGPRDVAARRWLEVAAYVDSLEWNRGRLKIIIAARPQKRSAGNGVTKCAVRRFVGHVFPWIL